jgi:hypothetical protein
LSDEGNSNKTGVWEKLLNNRQKVLRSRSSVQVIHPVPEDASISRVSWLSDSGPGAHSILGAIGAIIATMVTGKAHLAKTTRFYGNFEVVQISVEETDDEGEEASHCVRAIHNYFT